MGIAVQTPVNATPPATMGCMTRCLTCRVGINPSSPSTTTATTWYVNGDLNVCFFQTGYSDCGFFLGGPLGGFLTATELANPAGGDVIRIRFGINETDKLPRTYTKPATWRNAEGYNITFGRP